jgi:Lamin Tail Domain/Secretion system C-terminal sorting domain
MKTFITFILTIITSYNLQAQCTDLFISEYIEGSSSNKAFEIYNPTDNAIDLNDYVVYRNNNGSSTTTDSLFLQGSLPSKGVYTVVNFSANAAMLAVKDTLHTMTFYNGDDALWLKKISTSDTLDIIGEIGVDPGSGWTVGTGATNNFTLVRQLGIQNGQKNWAIGATEWDVFPINMSDSLSMHNMTPCTSLSISENSILESINIYPNPTNGNINISLNKTYRKIIINVFDINGRKVFNSNYTNQKNINLTINQNRGLYFIEAIIDDKRIVTKLILN